jgi:hypothetical protein
MLHLFSAVCSKPPFPGPVLPGRPAGVRGSRRRLAGRLAVRLGGTRAGWMTTTDRSETSLNLEKSSPHLAFGRSGAPLAYIGRYRAKIRFLTQPWLPPSQNGAPQKSCPALRLSCHVGLFVCLPNMFVYFVCRSPRPRGSRVYDDIRGYGGHFFSGTYARRASRICCVPAHADNYAPARRIARS